MRTPGLLLVLSLLPPAGCGGGGSSADAGPPDAWIPDPLCRPAAGAPSFTDVTSEWAGDLALVGNRLHLADLDGDGYPDLIVHPVAVGRPMLDAVPPVTTWRVLMNRPAGAGAGRAFEDATLTSGYGAARDGSPNRAATFAVAGDFDNDGDLDLFSGTYADLDGMGVDTGDRNDLFLNDGAGGFTRAAGGALDQTGLPWHATAATPLDYDRDGNLDVYVGFWYEIYGYLPGQQNRLYRGDGAGGFSEVTGPAGLTTTADGYAQGTNHRPTYGVTACDVDDDGWLDLLGSAYGRQWNQLFLNNEGTFADEGAAREYAADTNLDYSDNQFYRCWCQQNPGSCSPAPPAPVIACGNNWQPGVDDQPWRNGGNTFTTACGDADGDLDLDLYNAEIKHWHIGQSSDGSELLLNSGTGHFIRPGVGATGLSIPHPTADWNEGGLMAAFVDFDLDGHLDIYLAASDYPDNYGLLFRNLGDGTFEDVSAAAGVHHPCASGIAIGDLDGDGDEDLIVGSGTARDCGTIWSTNEVHVYRNDTIDAAAAAGNSLRLRLVGGAGSNRAAIGARVMVTATGLTLRRDVLGAYGHEAIGNDLSLTIGIAGACQADVQVRWPDAAGTVETFPGVLANYRVELSQGGGAHYID